MTLGIPEHLDQWNRAVMGMVKGLAAGRRFRSDDGKTDWSKMEQDCKEWARLARSEHEDVVRGMFWDEVSEVARFQAEAQRVTTAGHDRIVLQAYERDFGVGL